MNGPLTGTDAAGHDLTALGLVIIAAVAMVFALYEGIAASKRHGWPRPWRFQFHWATCGLMTWFASLAAILGVSVAKDETPVAAWGVAYVLVGLGVTLWAGICFGMAGEGTDYSVAEEEVPHAE